MSAGGILAPLKKYVHKFDYKDIAAVEEYFEKYPDQIAAVITEPVIVDEPQDGFLEKLQELCRKNGALLIFDEVVDGFRFGIGGAQSHFDVTYR